MERRKNFNGEKNYPLTFFTNRLMKREFILEFVIREFYVDGEKGREKSEDYWSMKKNYSLIFLWIKYEFILEFIIRDFFDGKL